MDNHKKKILHRMKIAKGHLEKVIDMVEKGEYCLDVIQQSQAVQSALSKADEAILENHLKTCVRDSMERGKNIDEKVKEVIEVFKRK
ncbi:MAG: metal-sensitive transcriptional regulator [Patescibacteria group bacterium]|jgi:DNA-binding FrmR family transcriptional regulator